MGQVEEMLVQLAPSLGEPQGKPVALEGGITNRNFRVRLGAEEYVIRIQGRDTQLLGIDREAERAASAAAAAMGIAPALVAALPGGLVSRFVECTEVPVEELRARVDELARSLRRFHDSALQLPSAFWVPDLLADYAAIVAERGQRLPAAYERTSATAARITAAVPLELPRPCHNDLLPGNIIRALEDGAILIVDWEYAGMGHPYFDLGNLSVNNDFDDATDDRLLQAYHSEPPSDASRARLKLMRVLSDAREAAWGVAQAAISELDFDFDAYANRHFERLLAAAEARDFEEWLAAA
ncbi:MAG TPA: phosphotransferase [Solirubrobacteraceae bacterium]|nr:phosphotransferase [Solirubrobacteraceae bacterium]